MNIIDVGLKFNGSLTYANNPQEIVLHHAEASNCTVQDIHSWHLANGWLGIGYHFFIDKQGNIYRGRPENAVGSHCPKHNSISLGVCFEGDFMTENMTQEQIGAYKELIKYSRAKYGYIPIYGHKELYSTECPGNNFPLEAFKDIVVSNISEIGWHKDATGWYYLTNTQGWYYKDSWQKIDGEWYSFDSEGYARQSVWLQDQAKWYYLKDNCKMAKVEWLWVDGECYCFNEHGELYVDCFTSDGYRVDQTGAWIQ